MDTWRFESSLPDSYDERTTMSEHDNTATIVWTANWPKVEKPHCTLAFLGDIDRIPAKYSDILEVMVGVSAAFPSPGLVQTQGIEYFGENRDTMVVLLDDRRLFPVHLLVMHELYKRFGVQNGSTFAGYKPHVTVGKKEDVLINYPFITPPAAIKLGGLQLWWGDQIW